MVSKADPFPQEERPARKEVLAHLAMLAYALLIAGSFAVGAVAAPFLSAPVLNAVRFLGAIVLMAALLAAREPAALRRPPRAPWRFLLLGGLMAAYFILMFVALRITDPVSTSAVFTLIPLLAAVFGIALLRQRVSALLWASLGVSAVGALWVIFRGDLARLARFEIGRGEALFFLGCVCQALYVPLVRLLNRGESTLAFTVWTIGGCMLWVTLFALPELVATRWTSLPAYVWWSILYLTLGSTALSFFLLQYASVRLPAARVFPYTYLVPTLVILIHGASGKGWPGGGVLAGAIVTVLGIAATGWRARR